MSIPVRDINKSVIMNMLRTDVFGYSADEIEAKSKELYNLVANGDSSSSGLRKIDGYGRNNAGYIVLFQKSVTPASKTKKK